MTRMAPECLSLEGFTPDADDGDWCLPIKSASAAARDLTFLRFDKSKCCIGTVAYVPECRNDTGRPRTSMRERGENKHERYSKVSRK